MPTISHEGLRDIMKEQLARVFPNLNQPPCISYIIVRYNFNPFYQLFSSTVSDIMPNGK